MVDEEFPVPDRISIKVLSSVNVDTSISGVYISKCCGLLDVPIEFVVGLAPHKTLEADDIKVTWTGFNNIEVVEGIREKKIYGDCVLILNEER